MNLDRLGRNEQGVTLIELLLYMGLLSILLVILTDVFVSVAGVYVGSKATSVVEQDGTFLMARLMYDIKRADAIVVPAVPGALGDTLTLAISGDTFTYTLSNMDLQLTNSLGTDNLNSSETTVENLSFLRLGEIGGTNNVRVQFRVNSVAILNKGTESKNFSFTVGLR